jgi:hypothetical protein
LELIVQGVRLIKGKEAILDKIVFELRYQRGFTYLDRCGRMLNALIDDHPEWTVDPNHPNPQSASLISLANSCVLSMGTRKMDLALEIPIGGESLAEDSIVVFADQVDHAASVVMDQLGLDKFDRIGCRLWYVFPAESKEESEEWLQSLGCYSVSQTLIRAFGGAMEALGVAVVISSHDRKYRISFNGVERTATLDLGNAVLNIRIKDLPSGQQELLREQERTKARVRRTPDFPAMIDIDAYVENPEAPDAKAFVKSTYDESLEYLRRAVGAQ